MPEQLDKFFPAEDVNTELRTLLFPQEATTTGTTNNSSNKIGVCRISMRADMKLPKLYFDLLHKVCSVFGDYLGARAGNEALSSCLEQTK